MRIHNSQTPRDLGLQILSHATKLNPHLSLLPVQRKFLFNGGSIHKSISIKKGVHSTNPIAEDS